MRKALRLVAPACTAIFVASLVIANTVYRGKEMSDAVWVILVPFGLLVCGIVATVGLGFLAVTRRTVK